MGRTRGNLRDRPVVEYRPGLVPRLGQHIHHPLVHDLSKPVRSQSTRYDLSRHLDNHLHDLLGISAVGLGQGLSPGLDDLTNHLSPSLHNGTVNVVWVRSGFCWGSRGSRGRVLRRPWLLTRELGHSLLEFLSRAVVQDLQQQGLLSRARICPFQGLGQGIVCGPMIRPFPVQALSLAMVPLGHAHELLQARFLVLAHGLVP